MPMENKRYKGIKPYHINSILDLVNNLSCEEYFEIAKSIKSCFGNDFAKQVPIALVLQEDLDKLYSEDLEQSYSLKPLLEGLFKSGHALNLEELTMRTAEQVAFEDVCNFGDGYISYANAIYKYTDGYYLKLDDRELLKTINDYFNIYKVRKGSSVKAKAIYAQNKHAQNALGYLKSRCYIPEAEINPRGINLANGFLDLHYENDKPVFELKEHSPKYYCLYKSRISYKPDLDLAEIEKIISNMIAKDDIDVFFRNLAASLDLETIIGKHSRDIKALFLYGTGSNGKDTLRTWIEELYSPDSVSHVSIQDFKSSDKGRNFNIANLAGKKINWSSENITVNIDNLQTLKSAITGDPLDVERKHEQNFTIKPNSIFLFNVNQHPVSMESSFAVTSRYGIVDLPFTFKKNADPNNQFEIEADPRLKDDLEYVQDYILPAFLVKLINSFKSLYEEGIDYTESLKKLEKIKENNYHLLRFIKDCEIKEIPFSPDTAVSVDDLFQQYKKWCIEEGFAERTDLKSFQVVEQNTYDKIFLTKETFSRAIRKSFPNQPDSSNNKVNGKRCFALSYKDPFSLVDKVMDEPKELEYPDEEDIDIEDVDFGE